MQNSKRSIENSRGLRNQLKISFIYSRDFTALSPSSVLKAHNCWRYNINGDFCNVLSLDPHGLYLHFKDQRGLCNLNPGLEHIRVVGDYTVRLKNAFIQGVVPAILARWEEM